jgi:hypothetical protein
VLISVPSFLCALCGYMVSKIARQRTLTMRGDTNIHLTIYGSVSNPRQMRTIPGTNFAHLDKCRGKRTVDIACTWTQRLLSFCLQPLIMDGFTAQPDANLSRPLVSLPA